MASNINNFVWFFRGRIISNIILFLWQKAHGKNRNNNTRMCLLRGLHFILIERCMVLLLASLIVSNGLRIQHPIFPFFTVKIELFSFQKDDTVAQKATEDDIQVPILSSDKARTRWLL